MEEVKDFIKIFQNNFVDLDNTSFLIHNPIDNNLNNLQNYEVHVFCDYIIRQKFGKMINFYKTTKENLFPKQLKYRFLFKQSLETKNHSLSLTEYYMDKYSKSEILKDHHNLKSVTLRKRERIHEDFLNQLFTSYELFSFLRAIEEENSNFKSSAIKYPNQYVRFLTSMLFITKSHRTVLTNDLIKESEILIPELAEPFRNFLKEPNEKNLNIIHDFYDKYYILSHFSEYCKDNILPAAELCKYEKITSTDISYLLLPYQVKPLEEDYGAVIKNIFEQTIKIYNQRLDYIHQKLNFN